MASSPAPAPASSATPPADATFTAADGKPVRLSDYRGKQAVVLLFMRGFAGEFACYYCGIQTRDYKTLHRKFREAGAEVLMVLPGATDAAGYLPKVGEGDPEHPDPAFSVPYPVLIDADFSACQTFHVPFKPGEQPFPVSRPATVVVGRDGNILYSYQGKDPSDRPAAETVLAALKGAKPASPASVPTPAASAGPGLDWVPYDEGMKKAQAEAKPVLLDFFGDWCGACKQMDTVVYSDSAVHEIARSFVCIRVEHGQRPDLVAQYGVKGLPDVHLMDAQGRELARLKGFTAASRLTAACRDALDRLQGKASSASQPASGTAVRTAEVTPEAIESSVKQGVAYLRQSRSKRWPPAAAGMEPDPVVLWAWAVCDVPPTDEDLSSLLKAVEKTPPASTYHAAFRAMALARLDTVAHRQGLEACARFLVATQLANGQWTYGPPAAGSQPPALGDNSNTAYALLGLAACRRAKVEIPAAALEKTEAWWRKAQNPDGGWGYRSDRETESYASMTESGIGSLRLCQVLLGHKPDKDEAFERALAWLGKHFSVSENLQSPYQQGRLLYHLYALERLGGLLGLRRIGDHDWYAEGTAYLLGTQKPDGSWDDGADTPVPNTAFALLFLKRATTSLR